MDTDQINFQMIWRMPMKAKVFCNFQPKTVLLSGSIQNSQFSEKNEAYASHNFRESTHKREALHTFVSSICFP